MVSEAHSFLKGIISSDMKAAPAGGPEIPLGLSGVKWAGSPPVAPTVSSCFPRLVPAGEGGQKDTWWREEQEKAEQ